jgi:clan AA aspartic protease (TIGR02281 family)
MMTKGSSDPEALDKSRLPDSAVTDFRSDYGGSTRIGSWAFAVIVMALVAGCGWAYQFRPQWVARAFDLAGLPRVLARAQDEAIVVPQNDSSDVEFAALYQKYGMPPLRTSVASAPRLNSALASLQKEPCDRQRIYQADVALEKAGLKREAAEMLKGFADNCPEGNGERHRASELYYLLGDYDTAVKLSSAVIDHQPDAQNSYFVRAKAEQGLQRYAAAIEDYTTLIQLLPETKSVVAEVFTRLSDSYDKLDRPCEAIGPIQTYIALDSEKRATPVLLKRVAALAAKGHCTQVYAKGVARIPRRSNGVSTAKVEINGIEGTFVVDTGASFITLTQGFANRVKPKMFKDAVEMQTANGTTSAKLATVDSVKLDGLYASSVPTIVASKSLGNGIDGLLGMSFLSRFSIAIRDREIQLTAKTLDE